MKNNRASILDKIKGKLSTLNLKTIIYTVGTLAVLILIVINTKNTNKYGQVKDDGKFYLDMNKISQDYGIDLNSTTTSDNLSYNDGSANITDDLGNSLLITTLYLDQNGLTDPTMKGKILANIILDYQKKAQGKVYTESDLNIIRGTDQKAMQDYYTNIDQAMADYQSNLQNLNLLTVDTSQANKTQDEFEQSVVDLKGSISANILKMIDLNSNLIDRLTNIPATTQGAQYQLELINSIAGENNYLKALAYIDTDPMKYLLINGDDFQDTFSKNLTTDLNNFRDYFKNNGVNLTS